MADTPDVGRSLFQQAPTIISELRLDYTAMSRINESIVRTILDSDVDVMSKAGMLERILPNLPRANSCACSCSCSCSCGGGGGGSSVAPQTGRVL